MNEKKLCSQPSTWHRDEIIEFFRGFICLWSPASTILASRRWSVRAAHPVVRSALSNSGVPSWPT